MERHPIRVVVHDDLVRSRLTVFFRLILAIPHFIWITLWSIGVVVIGIIAWFVALFAGRLPEGLHNFFAAYVRYTTHLYAYLYLAANPYPGFVGEHRDYPVELEIDGPAPQSRWKTGFRIFLALPAILLSSALGNFGGPSGSGQVGGSEDASGGETFAFQSAGALVAVAILGWFVCVVRGRMALGFRDLAAYGLRYTAQTLGFVLFLTDRYPSSDPREPAATQPTPAKPIRIRVEDDLRRTRLTVFFRFLLVLPHVVWLALWGIAVFFAAIAGWFAALATGRLPDPLHRFIGAYVRYQAHVLAFVYLIANPFPGFTGTPGSYPVDLEIDAPEPQNRWKTGFRIFLALPALIVNTALGGAATLVAIFGWFVGLFLGRMPEGLRNLGAYIVRYSGQTYGYLLLLTDSYAFAGPNDYVEPEPEVEPEPAPEWPAAPPLPSF